MGFTMLQLCSNCLSLAARSLLSDSLLFKIEASKIIFRNFFLAISERLGFQKYGFVRMSKPGNFYARTGTHERNLWRISAQASIDLVLLIAIWI
jgi:hypothetical protein